MKPRLDKARLFEDLGYWTHAGQQAVHRSKASRRVVACGVRWGKTWVGVYEVVAALLEPRQVESIGWVVGPDHTVADRILKLAHRAIEKHSPHRILEARHHALRVRTSPARSPPPRAARARTRPACSARASTGSSSMRRPGCATTSGTSTSPSAWSRSAAGHCS